MLHRSHLPQAGGRDSARIISDCMHRPHTWSPVRPSARAGGLAAYRHLVADAQSRRRRSLQELGQLRPADPADLEQQGCSVCEQAVHASVLGVQSASRQALQARPAHAALQQEPVGAGPLGPCLGQLCRHASQDLERTAASAQPLRTAERRLNRPQTRLPDRFACWRHMHFT